MVRAIYAGSFDPLTNGHLFVINVGLKLFGPDGLIVAIGENPAKQYTFSLRSRLKMIRSVFPNVSTGSYENRYLVDYAAEIGADFILRGIRNQSDYESETAFANINTEISKSEIYTIFVPTPKHLTEMSSSFVKAMVGPHNWKDRVKDLVPPVVFDELVKWHEST
ncbi:MAG: pantetheine-phosphate adenylyltransferase [Candidatus Paceibacterota bacterium]